MPECVLASNLTAHRLNEVSGPAVLQGPRHCRGAGAVDGLQHDKQDSPDDWYAEGVTSGLLTEAEQTKSMLCTGRSTQANDTMASSPSLPLASSCDHPRHHNQKGHYIAHINVAPQKMKYSIDLLYASTNIVNPVRVRRSNKTVPQICTRMLANTSNASS